MKTISVGELRQNPAHMLEDVEAGEIYVLTKHNREVGRIVPSLTSAAVVPAKRRGRSQASELPYVGLPGEMTMDELLNELKGDR
ncbi:MAG: type II toxin-antitoxin system Phd/YefM family antitoxin [Nesterenkonia sp.]